MAKILIIDDQEAQYNDLKIQALSDYQSLPENNKTCKDQYKYRSFLDKIQSYCKDPASEHEEIKTYLTDFFLQYDNKIDLLIIDVDLFGDGRNKSGIRLLKLFRNYFDFLNHTPAMLLTKYPQQEVTEALLNEGGRANYYLHRPAHADTDFNMTVKRVAEMLIEWQLRNPTIALIKELFNSRDEKIIEEIRQQLTPINSQLENLFEQSCELEKYTKAILSLVSYHIKYDTGRKGERIIDKFINEMGLSNAIQDLNQKKKLIDRFNNIKEELLESLKGEFGKNFLDTFKKEIKDVLALSSEDSIPQELIRIGCMAVIKPFLAKLDV